MARVAYTLPFGTSPMHDHEGPIAFAADAAGRLVSEEISEGRAARLRTIPGFVGVEDEAPPPPAAAPRGAEPAAAEQPKPTRRKGSAATP